MLEKLNRIMQHAGSIERHWRMMTNNNSAYALYQATVLSRVHERNSTYLKEVRNFPFTVLHSYCHYMPFWKYAFEINHKVALLYGKGKTNILSWDEEIVHVEGTFDLANNNMSNKSHPRMTSLAPPRTIASHKSFFMDYSIINLCVSSRSPHINTFSLKPIF